MPYLHIRLSGAADTALAERVAQHATRLTADHLNKDPALSAVTVEFVAPQHWFIAGKALRADGPRSYHWQVSITDETNTRREKAAYLAAVHEAMGALLGGVIEHAYVQVTDMRAGAYGYGGRTQEHRAQHPA